MFGAFFPTIQGLPLANTIGLDLCSFGLSLINFLLSVA